MISRSSWWSTVYGTIHAWRNCIVLGNSWRTHARSRYFLFFPR